MEIMYKNKIEEAQWLQSNLEAVLTNLKIRESAILEFPNETKSKSDLQTFGLLNKIPFCFDASKLYLGIQGKETRS